MPRAESHQRTVLAQRSKVDFVFTALLLMTARRARDVLCCKVALSYVLEPPMTGNEAYRCLACALEDSDHSNGSM